MAFQNVVKNRSTYLPYIGVCTFSMFTFFVFRLIVDNDVMDTVPRAAYAQALMLIGFMLLMLIMIPFLYYTNSFLIKRRKKELGLYSILGMEKKHMGLLLFVETLVIYVIVETAAVGLGLLFSRLLFLLLLNLAKLPARAEFAFSGSAFVNVLTFFGAISLMNLITNLWQVGKVKPIELLNESKKGEKKLRGVRVWSILGVLVMGAGYCIAIQAQIDSYIFTDFFLAVLLVAAGTYFLFTSGSVAVLFFLKKRKNFYYRPENFITVSGMLYRMKKNAAGLVNICIFSTMVIITAVCTLSLYLGMPGINEYMYPYRLKAEFLESHMEEGDKEGWLRGVEQLAEKYRVDLEKIRYYSYLECRVAKSGNIFLHIDGNGAYQDRYRMKFMTLAEYNRLEQSKETLKDGEVLLYCSGPDFLKEGEKTGHVHFQDRSFTVKKELQECATGKKVKDDLLSAGYTVIVKDEQTLRKLGALYGGDAAASLSWKAEFTPGGHGALEEDTESFVEEAYALSSKTPGFASFSDYAENVREYEAMCGGLLFIGIFFGLIFLICLLVIMYYKQITEGYEDRSSFEIMQKVGMSDKEVKRTIQKQILTVFFLPLLGAFCHTAVGMNLVIKLLGTLSLHDKGLIICCAAGVSAVFAAVYVFCYKKTAKTYYRIVKWKQI